MWEPCNILRDQGQRSCTFQIVFLAISEWVEYLAWNCIITTFRIKLIFVEFKLRETFETTKYSTHSYFFCYCIAQYTRHNGDYIVHGCWKGRSDMRYPGAKCFIKDERIIGNMREAYWMQHDSSLCPPFHYISQYHKKVSQINLFNDIRILFHQFTEIATWL